MEKASASASASAWSFVHGVDKVEEEDRVMELPAGFRFHPTDEELISYYLHPKVLDSNFSSRAIGDVDLNKCEPWDLPKMAKLGEKEELYFFCVRDRKYPTGMRTNRATESGYWKATGKDKEISRGKSVVGMKKTLVFYRGRAPKGEKSNWVMHEFRLDGVLSPQYLPSSSKNEWVICRVFEKNSTSSSSNSKKNYMMMRSRSRWEDEDDDDQLRNLMGLKEEDDEDDDTSSFEFNPSSSSILPPLMDPSSSSSSPPRTGYYYYHHNNNTSKSPIDGHHQYVPCFSNDNITNTPQHQHQHQNHHQYYPPSQYDHNNFNNSFTNMMMMTTGSSSISNNNNNSNHPLYHLNYPIPGTGTAATSSSPQLHGVSHTTTEQEEILKAILDNNNNNRAAAQHQQQGFRTDHRDFGRVPTLMASMSQNNNNTCLDNSSTYEMSRARRGSIVNREEEGPSISDCGGGGGIMDDIDSFWSY